MLKKIKARILTITKDDMKICSSRVIWAKVVSIESGDVYCVAWAQTPVIFGITGVWRSRAQDAFQKVWECSQNGDEVWLYHAEDKNVNYLEPV